MKRFVISDTHLGHANIIKYCDRPFSSVEEMNDKIISNWNSVVSADDVVYFLGDFCYGKPMHNASRLYREKLNGKIHLILGNHDKGIHRNSFESASNYSIIEVLSKKILLIHYPIHHCSEENDRIVQKFNCKNLYYNYCFHGHIHNRKGFMSGPKHYNVSVEQINYTPLDLDLLISNL